jgi:hypothetical protein
MKFETSVLEEKSILEWQKQHQADDTCPYERMCCHFEPHPGKLHSTNLRYCGAIGGQFSYEFTHTGVGTCVTVHCGCGHKKDCTDYSDW